MSTRGLGRVFSEVDPVVRDVLERCLEGRRLAVADAVMLCGASGPDLQALCAVADRLRAEQAGETVSYVINRNINFTNVCVKSCKFCAFSRSNRSEEGYFLDSDEIIRRGEQAKELGATELCIQAGLPPKARPGMYVDMLRAIKRALPDLDLHAMSPEEVKYGAELSRMPIRAYLEQLKDVGLSSLPGTSAEILDDAVRRRIAGGRITTSEWIEVIKTAHELGLPTSSTIMYGHIETDEQRIRHLDLLRAIQDDTGGFTEFVPLSFVHSEAPLYLKRMLPDVRPGPSGNDVIRMIAISRLMLGPTFRNIQTSWVKEGLRQAQWLLSCGANDLGGTLMNESISTAAGAGHGQLASPARLRELIRDCGRTPAQRDTRYRILRTFSADGSGDGEDPLDRIEDAEASFGSYARLVSEARLHRSRSTA